MIKITRNNYRIYGFKIVKTAKTLLMLDYGFSNATIGTLNHAFALPRNA
jgi:hypothetical protein